MENNSLAAALIDRLLKRHIAFACWYHPRDLRLGLLIGNKQDVHFYTLSDQLNGAAGFVFAPFRLTAHSPAILLKPAFYTEDLKPEQMPDMSVFEPFNPVSADEPCQTQSKDEYLKMIADSVAAIRAGKLSKVILSRQIPIRRNHMSLSKLFFELQRHTPNAFTYLVNLPVAGTWMGATPEVLIKSNGEQFETVSLAGTQIRKPDAEEYFWSTKDIEEQAFVSRYMLDVFFDFDIHQYKTTGPETLESGKVAHLKTSFFFPKEKVENQLGNFVAELHPTPAVCGLPKETAYQFIRENERYQRKYYTGYLGPWRLDGQVSLFVNLRCMEITSDEYILYAGGGITARSVPEKEWDETNQKAKTLLSVIDNEGPLPVFPKGES
jgi:isochorismate synthase